MKLFMATICVDQPHASRSSSPKAWWNIYTNKMIKEDAHVSLIRTNLSIWLHIDDLVQDCSNSIANALELLQSCTKPSI